MDIPQALIQQIKRTVIKGGRIVALTGAGISAESGIPTFRQAQTGLWAQYDPMELATPQAFHRNPKLVWDWYTWRRELIKDAAPNAGHFALTALENLSTDFLLLTQNVDNLHQAAGSQRVVELHGNIMQTKCSVENTSVEMETYGTNLPTCPACGGLLRPDVVWFNENLPAEAFRTALDASQTADVFFSIGTSTLVQPAASLPLMALENNAVVIEINPQKTPITGLVHYALQGSAANTLPFLIEKLK